MISLSVWSHIFHSLFPTDETYDVGKRKLPFSQMERKIRLHVFYLKSSSILIQG